MKLITNLLIKLGILRTITITINPSVDGAHIDLFWISEIGFHMRRRH